MEYMQVRGRMLADAQVTTTCDEGGVTVRIDTERDPEFWCEVDIRARCLIEMLERIAAHSGRGTLNTYAALKHLREQLTK